MDEHKRAQILTSTQAVLHDRVDKDNHADVGGACYRQANEKLTKFLQI